MHHEMVVWYSIYHLPRNVKAVPNFKAISMADQAKHVAMRDANGKTSSAIQMHKCKVSVRQV
jgi:hypothetical protein